MNRERLLINVYFLLSFFRDMILIVTLHILDDLQVGEIWTFATILICRICIFFLPYLYVLRLFFYRVDMKEMFYLKEQWINRGQKIMLLICLWSLCCAICEMETHFIVESEKIQDICTVVSFMDFIIIAPIVEGIVIHGLILKRMQAYSKWLAIIISSITFAFPYYPYWPVMLTVGFFLGVFYTETKDLKSCIILHSLINITMIINAFVIKNLIEKLLILFGIFLMSLPVLLKSEKCREVLFSYRIRSFLDDFREKKDVYQDFFSMFTLLGYVLFVLLV